MSKAYEGQDPLTLAAQAEQDLKSHGAKHGHDLTSAQNSAGPHRQGPHGSGQPEAKISDSTMESGVDEGVRGKMPGADVAYGSGISGRGDNRPIPLSEGGELNPGTERPFKARDYEGDGGPEDKMRLQAQEQPGSDDVRGNVVQ